MEISRKLFSTGKNQNTKQNIDNGRLNLTTFEVRGEIPLAYSTNAWFLSFYYLVTFGKFGTIGSFTLELR